MSSDVENIKGQLDIVDVVGSYVKLEKGGKSFKACCPFHNESTPSFHVSPDRGMYYCFGCSRGGDIFSFVQEIEGLDFYSTLKLLADKAGVELTGNKSEGVKPKLLEIVEVATKFYEVRLRKDPEVVEYLLGRGMTKGSVTQFRIGYAPNGWGNLYDFLKRKGYRDQDIDQAGLVIRGDKGYYDRFRERIMFPIADSQGRVIGFSGRIFTKSDSKTDTSKVGKYVNSPDGALYDKSRVLYGYDKSKRAMSNKDMCVLVEGQVDVVMSHQAGIDQTLALSGTALTEFQVSLIRRFTDNLVIALDADDAGIKAAARSAQIALQHDMYVSVVNMGDGRDPADLVKENAELWIEKVNSAQDFVAFRLDVLATKSLDARKKQQAVHRDIFPYLHMTSNPVYQDGHMGPIGRYLGVSTDAVRADFQKWKSAHTKTSPVKATEVNAVRNVSEEKSEEFTLLQRLLGILIWQLESSDKVYDPAQHILRILEITELSSLDELLAQQELTRDQLAMRSSLEYADKSDKLAGEAAELMVHIQIEYLEIKKKKLHGLLAENPEAAEETLRKIDDIIKKIDTIKSQR